MLLPIDVTVRPVQLMLDSRPFAQREFAARTTRERFIESYLRLLSLEPRRFNPSQFATANALSNPLLLMPLARIDAVPAIAPTSLRQSRRRNHRGHQRRHCKPFHKTLHATSLSRPIERETLKSYALGALSDKTEVNSVKLGKVLLKNRSQ